MTDSICDIGSDSLGRYEFQRVHETALCQFNFETVLTLRFRVLRIARHGTSGC